MPGIGLGGFVGRIALLSGLGGVVDRFDCLAEVLGGLLLGLTGITGLPLFKFCWACCIAPGFLQLPLNGFRRWAWAWASRLGGLCRLLGLLRGGLLLLGVRLLRLAGSPGLALALPSALVACISFSCC